MKRLIFALLCALCLVSCINSADKEISSPEVSFAERTAEVPENASYKQTMLISRDDDEATGVFNKILNYYDENDNLILYQKYILGEPETLLEEEYYTYENGLLISMEKRHDDIYVTEYKYNADKNILEELCYKNGGISGRFEYRYDENGVLLQKEHYEDNVNDYTVIYEYDEQGRVIREYSDEFEEWKRYVYDEKGNISQESSGRGSKSSSVMMYTYDENNRIISGKCYAYSKSSKIIYDYEYSYEFYK